MKKVSILVWLLGLGGAAIGLDCLDGYHALYGTALLIPLVAFSLLFMRWLRRGSKKAAVRAKAPSSFVQVACGLIVSGITICLLWGGFSLLALAGAPNPFENAERVKFSLSLAEAEHRQDFDEAIRLIEQQLSTASEEVWKAELRSRLFENLVEAGRRVGDPQQAIPHLKRAVEYAVTAQESVLVDLLLAQAERSQRLSSAKDAFREAGQWSDLADLLKSVCALQLEHQWHGDARKELFDVLVEQGRAAISLEDARAAFAEAIAVGQRYKIDSLTATRLADEIDALHELKSQPALRDLIALLKQRMKRFPPGQSVGMLYEALVEYGATLQGFEDQVALYQEAVELAQQYNFESSHATKELEAVLAKISGRRAVLEQVQTLRSQKNYGDLITFLKDRIATRPKEEWHFPLAQWQLDAYCGLADQSDLRARIDICRTAAEFAKQHDLDASDIESRLKAAESERERQAAFLNSLRELKSQRRFTELISILRVHAETPRDEWLCAADQSLYHSWLAWGDATTDLNDKLYRYQQAVAVSKRFSLIAGDAETKCERIRAEISRMNQDAAARNRPADLPPGSQANVLRISMDPYPPSLFVRVEILDGAQEPIKTLERKDFVVTLNGKLVSAVALAPIQQETIPLSTLVCLDTSGSTGDSLGDVVVGTKQLVNRLELSNDSVKIASFNTKTETVCEWTSDKGALCKRLDGLRSGGETALFETIIWGANELSQRAGARCLVVFTDGRNTFGDATLAQTVAACQRANVRVHAIGLRTADLDTRALSALANETGGRYVEAASTSELSEMLADTSERVRQHYYRLILTPETSIGPINHDTIMSVRVGGKNSVEVSEPVQQNP